MLTVSLSKRELVTAGACDEGVALFDALKAVYDSERARLGKAPKRGLTVRWTRLHAVWFAAAYPGFAGWMVGHGLIPAANLDGANLDGANLDGASLDGANLDGANLDGASLDGANLDGASLDGASLVLASLVRASLVGASLDGANLVGANLDGANLVGANLDGAKISRGKSPPDGWEAEDEDCGCCSRLRRKVGAR